jgi:hypothetical protein
MNKQAINKLNVMNYQVNNTDGHYYLCDGINDLKKFSAQHEIDFQDLCDVLLSSGQYEYGSLSITMI